MGPAWGRQDPDGPHVGPMICAIWVYLLKLIHFTLLGSFGVKWLQNDYVQIFLSIDPIFGAILLSLPTKLTPCLSPQLRIHFHDEVFSRTDFWWCWVQLWWFQRNWKWLPRTSGITFDCGVLLMVIITVAVYYSRVVTLFICFILFVFLFVFSCMRKWLVGLELGSDWPVTR